MAAGDQAGVSVAGTGDVNGDRIADVILGARLAGNNGRAGSGSAYVVFGQATPTRVDLGGQKAITHRLRFSSFTSP